MNLFNDIMQTLDNNIGRLEDSKAKEKSQNAYYNLPKNPDQWVARTYSGIKMEGIDGNSTYEEIGDAWVHGMARQLRDKYYPHCDVEIRKVDDSYEFDIINKQGEICESQKNIKPDYGDVLYKNKQERRYESDYSYADEWAEAKYDKKKEIDSIISGGHGHAYMQVRETLEDVSAAMYLDVNGECVKKSGVFQTMDEIAVDSTVNNYNDVTTVTEIHDKIGKDDQWNDAEVRNIQSTRILDGKVDSISNKTTTQIAGKETLVQEETNKIIDENTYETTSKTEYIDVASKEQTQNALNGQSLEKAVENRLLAQEQSVTE